jgi:sulfoxide reductase heme-binding subunit YedZ
MMTFALGGVGPSAYWYLTRSSGAVALVLLTGSVVLGVVDLSRWSNESWPRFVLDSLHRSVSLLAVVFVGLHVVTAALDSFAPISIVDAVVPFVGGYRPIWLGLGAVALDLLLAIVITSLMRQRVGYRAWRATHWLAYACWPVALVHTLGTGSDVKVAWLLAISTLCLLAVLAAVLTRLRVGWPSHALFRGGALAACAVLLIALLAWLPGGPLGKGWARRSGTPLALLASAASPSAHGSSASVKSSSKGSQAGPLAVPFRANLVGSFKQQEGPSPSLVTVRIQSTFNGAPTGRLAIELNGEPLDGGGVSLRRSAVTLGSVPDPAIYRGAITSLEGTHIAARVTDANGHQLALEIDLQINSADGSVSGTLSARPATRTEGR